MISKADEKSAFSFTIRNCGDKEMAKKENTYSRKTDKHDEHKHLFGSSGNTDFIINMTPEGAKKLAGIYAMIAIILVGISAVPYYLGKQFGTPNQMLMLQTDLNQGLAILIMTAVVLAGFVGALVFMVLCVKKEVVLARNRGLLIFAAIIAAALVSTLASADPLTGIFGYLDRAEGLLTLMGYIGFFTIGICLTDDKWRKNAGKTIIGIGTANAVIGILQSIPALAKYVPSYYNYLFADLRTNIFRAEYFNAYAGYDASYAADGVTCSPFALAALMTVASALALDRAAYAEKNSSRIINLVCTGLMFGAAIVTQTITALIGIGSVIVISLVISLTDRKCEGEKKGANKAAVVTSLLAAVTCGAIAAGVVLTDNFRLRDEHIMFTDSFERLSIAPFAHPAHEDNIYPTLWYEGWLTFTDHAVLGVGPDCWITMYADGEGMATDRTYNEYLDTALTRGAVGLALYLVLLVMTFIKAARMLAKAHRGDIDKGTAYGLFTAYTAYLIQAFVNITSLTVTPFFMLTAGIIWSYEAVTGSPKKNAEEKDNN